MFILVGGVYGRWCFVYISGWFRVYVGIYLFSGSCVDFVYRFRLGSLCLIGCYSLVGFIVSV